MLTGGGFGASSLTYLVPKIWDIVPQEMKVESHFNFKQNQMGKNVNC